MKTATSKVVTILDVSVVVSACIAGTFCGIYGLPFVRRINQRLLEADNMLAVYLDRGDTGTKTRSKNKGIIMLALVCFIITAALALDIWVWYRIADKIKSENKDSSANVLGYFPFYCLYYILMMFHVLFAQSALGLGSRYRALNLTLYQTFPELLTAANKLPQIEITSVSSTSNAIEKNADIALQTKGLGAMAKTTVVHVVGSHRRPIATTRVIVDLAEIHASLSNCIMLVSKTFGVALLAVLGSCLLHLVATSYFLMVELVGDKDAVFAWIQALWLFIHILRFLLTIEPCHITNEEANRTITIVSTLLRMCKDPDTKKSINVFWKQLVGNNSLFTACGLCTLDRHIITSYCGAIATYLVILIQFKEADDHTVQQVTP